MTSLFSTDGHVAASVCAPSRCGLLTGLAPARLGFDANQEMLLADSRTIGHAMQACGYSTLGVGKWHMGPDPRRLGFDHFTGFAADPEQAKELGRDRPADRERLLARLDQWELELPAPRALVEPVYRDNLRRKHEMDVIGREAERKLP